VIHDNWEGGVTSPQAYGTNATADAWEDSSTRNISTSSPVPTASQSTLPDRTLPGHQLWEEDERQLAYRAQGFHADHPSPPFSQPSLRLDPASSAWVPRTHSATRAPATATPATPTRATPSHGHKNLIQSLWQLVTWSRFTGPDSLHTSILHTRRVADAWYSDFWLPDLLVGKRELSVVIKFYPGNRVGLIMRSCSSLSILSSQKSVQC
jgi:hypothetical protein